MYDYLIKSNSLFEISLPKRSSYLEVKAIKQFPSEEGGNIVYSPGFWHIISISDGDTFPQELNSFVQASGSRKKGINLPDGIISLSTVWAGMTIRS